MRARRRWAVAGLVALTACSAPAVSLPDPDPSRAPTTVAPPTTERTFEPPTAAPPTTEPLPTTAAPTATTVPDPPNADRAVAEIPFALAMTEGVVSSPQLLAVVVTAAGIDVIVAGADGPAGYRWERGDFSGPHPVSGTSAGGTFAVADVNPAAARRGFDFIDTYIGGVGVVEVRGVAAAPGLGPLWIVTAQRADGSVVTGVFDRNGDVRELHG